MAIGLHLSALPLAMYPEPASGERVRNRPLHHYEEAVNENRRDDVAPSSHGDDRKRSGCSSSRDRCQFRSQCLGASFRRAVDTQKPTKEIASCFNWADARWLSGWASARSRQNRLSYCACTVIVSVPKVPCAVASPWSCK